MSDLLNKASLVMIPSGYKEDVVYSAVPTDGSGDLSFTRSSNGTRINSAGLVEVCPWNLLTNSENFNTGGWTKNNCTITTNAATAPNGTNTASQWDLTGGATSTIYAADNSGTSVFTQSFYLKYVSGDKYFFVFSPLNAQGAKVWFDIQNGTVANQSSGFTGTIESVGNGWYRCSVCNTSAVTINYVEFGISTTSSGTALTNNSVAYLWGAQLNIGSTAKPYFPTTDRLNVPRLTYQNGGGGCPSLLLEKQSTNLVAYSDDFSNAWWSKYTASVTANQVTSPDGTQNADKVLADSGTYGVIYTSQIFTVGQVITSSCYIKQGDGTLVNFGHTDNGADYYARFDVANGTIVTTSGVTASIQNVGNGWFRCIINRTMAGNANLYIQLSDAGKYVYCYGAQAEVSSYATSYIPTTSSSATRVADFCYKTGISSLFGTNQGTFFIDLVYNGSVQYGYLFDVTDSANTQRILMYDTTGTGLFAFFDSASGAFTTIQLTKGQRYKIAVKYNSIATYWYVNGVLSATGSFGFAQQLSEIYLGIRYSLTDNSNIQVNETIIFPTALTSTELASLTTI